MAAFWISGILLLGGTVWLCVREILLFRAGESIISRRQLIVRMIGGMITLALVAKVMAGVLFVQPDMRTASYFLEYWLGCVGLAFLAVAVALIDVYSVLGYRRKLRRELNGGAGRLYARVLAEAAGHAKTKKESDC